MSSVLSAIGFALDFVGAGFLVIGLFRRVRPTVPGYAYVPDDAGRDAAFGVAGGSLLGFGFVLQSLSYFGVFAELRQLGQRGRVGGRAGHWRRVCPRHAGENAPAGVRPARAEALRKWPDITLYPLDRRRGLWFWRPGGD